MFATQQYYQILDLLCNSFLSNVMLHRSKSDNWLVGPRKQELTESKLPSQKEVPAVFTHLHKVENKTMKKRAALLAFKK